MPAPAPRLFYNPPRSFSPPVIQVVVGKGCELFLRLYSPSAHVLVELLRVKEQHAAPWFVARDLALVREL